MFETHFAAAYLVLHLTGAQPVVIPMESMEACMGAEKIYQSWLATCVATRTKFYKPDADKSPGDLIGPNRHSQP
jgi:hypothetical protein